MWILFAFLSAFFAGITTIFIKVGINDVNTSLALAIRTAIVLVVSFIIVLFIGSIKEIINLDFKTILFLILSGVSTTLLWIFYFKSLEIGDLNKVSPIDKTSIIFTLLLSSLFLQEQITYMKIISMLLILLGTFIMTYIKNNKSKTNKWVLYAFLTAIFTSLTTVLGKIGIKNIESNLGIFIRTTIVFIIIFIIILYKKEITNIKNINKKNWLFLILSGITTGLSWTFYFVSLKNGDASIVFSIEKLNIVIVVVLSSIFLKEKVNIKTIIGLILIIIGTLLLIL